MSDIEQPQTYGDVMEIARKIFVERNAVHKDLWKQYGFTDSLSHIRHKMARVNQLLASVPDGQPVLVEDLDDAFDAINYLAFCILNATAGNRDGVEP